MSIFVEELKKLLIKRKLLLLLLFALLIKTGLVVIDIDQQVLFQDQALQNEYLSSLALLEGSLTPEKETLLLAEKSRADESDARIGEAFTQLSTGQITPQQFDALVAAEEVNQNRKPVIEHLYQQYQYVVADPVSRYFVDPVGWSALLANELPDYLLIFVTVLFGVLVFYCEDASRMIPLNLTSEYGRIKLAAVKLVILGLLCSVLVVGFFAIELISTFALLGLSGFAFPVQSIPFFSSSDESLSLGLLLLQLLGLRMVGVLLLASCVQLVYLCSCSAIAALTAGLAIAIIPPFVFGMDGFVFRLPLPTSFLIGNGFYRGSESLLVDNGIDTSMVYLFREVPDGWFIVLTLLAILCIALLLVLCVSRFLASPSRETA